MSLRFNTCNRANRENNTNEMDSIILSNTLSETSDHHAIVRFVIFPFTTQNPKKKTKMNQGQEGEIGI